MWIFSNINGYIITGCWGIVVEAGHVLTAMHLIGLLFFIDWLFSLHIIYDHETGITHEIASSFFSIMATYYLLIVI